MKNTLILLLISLVLLIVVFAGNKQNAVWEIVSSDRTIKVNSRLFLPKDTERKKLNNNDTIVASNGTVTIKLKYGKENYTCILHANKMILVKNLVNSSFIMLDAKDGFKAIAGRILYLFMGIHEGSKTYFERYQREIAGPKKGGQTDILSGKQYKTELRTNDSVNIKNINDSLRRTGIIDSAVYYFSDAIYFEQENYLWKAYENYRNAYNFLKKENRESGVVTAVLKQFLYRLGRFKEGDRY